MVGQKYARACTYAHVKNIQKPSGKLRKTFV